MSSPLATLAWEIWQRGRRLAWLALGCLAFCVVVRLTVPEPVVSSEGIHAVYGLLMVLSLLLVMGIFNYTEYNATREWHGFPYRLFVLPIRTWRLVTLPMLLGVVSVELLYVAWIKLVWTRDDVPGWFAVILGAYMIFYLGAIWGLARFRITRIIVLGLGGTSSIAVACLPFYGKIAPSPWFEEKRLSVILAGLALIAFLAAWAIVARQRCGGGSRRSWLKSRLEHLSDALPRRTKDFASPAAAQFWFEWRRSGWLLPVCTAFALVVLIGPFAWFNRANPDYAIYILIRILAVPVVLAFAIGKAFIKPDFWTANLSLPPFLAVRPLPAGEFVVSKMKVAALSVAITWLLDLAFVALWFHRWANTRELGELLGELRLLHPYAWPVILVLSAAALAVLTWRCLVGGLWVGLSGNRSYFANSLGLQVIVPVLLALTAAIESEKIDAEIHNQPQEAASLTMAVGGWLLALAVIGKLWWAVFSWRKIAPHRAKTYLLVWSGVTLSFVALGVWSAPWADTYRQEHLYVLGAFLLVPLARLGWAPSSLAGNRAR